MSFKGNYYKPLCDYYWELLKPINKSSIPCDEEIIRRDFVSRSYYSVLLHCKDNITLLSTDKSTHENIINSVNDNIKDDLLSLKNLRVQADYKTHPFPKPLKVKNTIVHLERVNAIVKYILSLEEDCIKP
ncbi:hypothetical protein [Sulfurimonas sp. NWX79]|uniref:hypothetical protein n=1 Tax=Campylobacterales TaxID=213849 RepID=UPI00320478A0|nr:hypothetical protein IAPFLPAM_00060 [Sulfurimonas phage SNW-1]